MTVDLLVKVRDAVKMHDDRSPGQGIRDAVKMHDGRSPGQGPRCSQDA